ncbi:MAG: MBL fold metallo-hydrolase [bacterium]
MSPVEVCLLHIYFIDVLGGAATVIITPQGETILVDSGWYTEDGRDADRILEPLKLHGITQIDHCITTHWHRDHYGAIGHLSERIPIKNFYDRGIPDSFPEDDKYFEFLIERYKKASGGRSSVLRPGDTIRLKESPGEPMLELLCVAANREVIPSVASECANDFCKSNKPRPEDTSDNANSIALRLSYGDFQFFLGGDITRNIEYNLVCPDNRIGVIDLYMVNHHGFDISNNPVFLKSLNPTAAVFCNGPEKGCSPKVVADLRNLPDIQAIYQLHRNVKASNEENTDPAFIANPDPEKSGQYIKATVAEDTKSLTLTIGEKGNPRTFLCK